MNRVVVRIKGGLGNQLFCYAAARRLALVNEAELVIDDVTGFSRDTLYGRSYMLDNFSIPCRKATPAERMEPFERARRAAAKLISRVRPFDARRYIEQEGIEFDPRLLDFKFQGTVYIDGLWQSENYFKDHQAQIRSDLKMKDEVDEENLSMARLIKSSESVAVHFRFFDKPDSNKKSHNLGMDYYKRALDKICIKIRTPHFFIFSDQPQVATQLFGQEIRHIEAFTIVDINQESGNDFNDFWLMTKCKHFIIANSTFSWWAAWLSTYRKKSIIVPAVVIRGLGITSWGFKGLVPAGWTKL